MNNSDLKQVKKERLLSLDALRGLDMFFLVGLGGIFRALPKLSDSPVFLWFSDQCRHPAWEGFTAWDIIFPMFIFIVGAAMPFSFAKRLSQEGGKKELYKHIITRAVVLSVLGVILRLQPGGAHPYYGYNSVLYRIGFSYLFAGIIMMNFNIRQQAYWAFGILAGYWLALRFIPVPGFGAGDFSEEGNLNTYIASLVAEHISPDFKLMLSLSLLPSVSNALFGVLAGHWLKNAGKSPQKALWLGIAGTSLIVSGLLLHFDFPIHKKLLTSSFILVTSGISAMFLAFFYWLIDIKGYKAWAFFFVVAGMNSLTIYVADSLLNFKSVTNIFVGDFDFWNAQALVFALAAATIKWLFLYYLYRQKVFLKI